MRDRLFILFLFIISAVILPNVFIKEKSTSLETIRLYIEESGEILTLTAEEYVLGCISAQIPIDYEEEALKAQAAAAMTYGLRLIEDLKQADGEIPENADLSDSSEICQPFFTSERCKEEYGESYEKYLPVLKRAAAYGASHVITYKKEPIYSVYHSVSAGRTRSAIGVWGRDFDYIKPAESGWDRDYINYECVNEMTAEAARLALVGYKADIETPADYSKWFSDFNVNEDGYVISVKIGNNIFSGGDIWRIFKLRSTAFTVEYRNEIFVFTTKGYGHGAGLSQYGANEMAKEGKTAEEILYHYYGDEVRVEKKSF